MKVMVSILVFLAMSSIGQAKIQWTWENVATGTERGTFVTDGMMVGGAAPAGSYTVLDFSVTASIYGLRYGSILDGQYSIGMPDIGFDWDGSMPTVFWRQSGGYTNGFSVWGVDVSPGDPDRVGFGVDWFTVDDYHGDVTFIIESATPVLIPISSVVENETGTFGAIKKLYR